MTRVPVSGRLVLIVLALFGTAAGCGQGDGRANVSGTVQIGDEPIRSGFVFFEPAGGNNDGRQGHAPIRDGKFDTRDGGEASVSGPVIVRIQGWGTPSERFPNGVPVCHNYEIKMELAAGSNEVGLKVPESARVKEPKGGWGEPP